MTHSCRGSTTHVAMATISSRGKRGTCGIDVVRHDARPLLGSTLPLADGGLGSSSLSELSESECDREDAMRRTLSCAGFAFLATHTFLATMCIRLSGHAHDCACVKRVRTFNRTHLSLNAGTGGAGGRGEMGRMCWRACAAGAAGAASSRGGAAGRASDDAPICAGLHVRRARAASHPCPCFLAPVQVARRSSASAAAPACGRCGPSGCGPSPGVPPPLTRILCSCSPCTGCGFWLALFWLALGCMAMGLSWAQWWEVTFGSSSL